MPRPKKPIVVKRVGELYQHIWTLLVCTDVEPFADDPAYGWFAILSPAAEMNEFDHFLWKDVELATPDIFAKMTRSQKHSAVKKTFSISEREKKYQ